MFCEFLFPLQPYVDCSFGGCFFFFFFLSLKGILKVSLNFSHGFHLFYLSALCLDVFLVLDFLSLVSFNTDAEYLSQNVFA